MKAFLAFFTILLLVSCETDFDLTSDYKEITVVYGLISQNDSVHYLRINKAFLGDGNALEYAQNPDSNNYGADIDVVMTEVTPSGTRKEIRFDTVTFSTVDSGTFYHPQHLFYRANATLDDDNYYELKVTNKKTGNEVKSGTSLASDFSITKPNSGAKSLGFKRIFTSQQKFEWNSGKNGKRYQLLLHFNFKEKSSGQDTIHRVIDWYFPEQIASGLEGNEKMSVEYYNEDFYTLCNNLIPYGDPAREEAVDGRVADYFDLEFVVIGDDFSTYLDVNGPTSGLLLEKSVYTNVVNGMGIFSCKYTKHRNIAVSAETKIDLFSTTSLMFAEPHN